MSKHKYLTPPIRTSLRDKQRDYGYEPYNPRGLGLGDLRGCIAGAIAVSIGIVGAIAAVVVAAFRAFTE